MANSKEFFETNPKMKVGDIKWKIVRDTKLRKALERFKHACTCSTKDCAEIDCDEMKSWGVHFKLCTKVKRDCRSCKQFLALCIYHAKRSKECESDECFIPYCAGIKHSLMLRKKKKQKSPKEKAVTDLVADDVQCAQNERGATALPMQENQGAVRPEAGNIGNPQNAMQKQALLQLMQTLRSPQSPEQQRQILTILKANPQLMAAFIEQRQQNLLRQNSVLSPFSGTPLNFNVVTPNRAVQLRNLVHSHRCVIYQTVTESPRRPRIPCLFEDCYLWSVVVKHSVGCTTPNCTVLHCASSKFLLNHWEQCNTAECGYCAQTKRSLILQGFKFWEMCADARCQICTSMAFMSGLTIDSVRDSLDTWWHRFVPFETRLIRVNKIRRQLLPDLPFEQEQFLRLMDLEDTVYKKTMSKTEYEETVMSVTYCIFHNVPNHTYGPKVDGLREYINIVNVMRALPTFAWTA